MSIWYFISNTTSIMSYNSPRIAIVISTLTRTILSNNDILLNHTATEVRYTYNVAWFGRSTQSCCSIGSFLCNVFVKIILCTFDYYFWPLYMSVLLQSKVSESRIDICKLFLLITRSI